MERHDDAETRLFAARVLREVADILEGEDESGRFLSRWTEYERVRRGVELRAVEREDESAQP